MPYYLKAIDLKAEVLCYRKICPVLKEVYCRVVVMFVQGVALWHYRLCSKRRVRVLLCSQAVDFLAIYRMFRSTNGSMMGCVLPKPYAQLLKVGDVFLTIVVWDVSVIMSP